MTTMPIAFHRLFLLFAFLLAALGGQVAAAPSDPVEADRIVAVVGDEVITMVELRVRMDSALKQLQKQGTPLPPREELERQMLERAIMERIQLQFAQGTGLRIDDAQLDQAIGRIAANNRMTPQQFKLALEKDGVRYARFREEIRDEMTMVRLREREVDSRLVISDGEVDAYLANQTAGGGRGIPVGAHPLAGAGVGDPRAVAEASPARRAGPQAGTGRRELRRTGRRLLRCAGCPAGRQPRLAAG